MDILCVGRSERVTGLMDKDIEREGNRSVLDVTIEEVIDYVVSEYDGVVVAENWGERGLFYNPGGTLPKGVYILTFKEKDGPNDKASNVNRPGVYRLNLGLSKSTFKAMFNEIPKRPAAGRIIDTGHRFDDLDTVMPHPVYGWSAWVCVLNPSRSTFEALKPLIREGFDMAKTKFMKRIKS